MDGQTWIALIQALAYITLAIVAIITLKRASSTVLQPVRTETFKVQLEELRRILQVIGQREESQLREIFGFGELLAANAVRLHDRFFRDVYGVTVAERDRPYSLEGCSYSIVGDNFLAADHEGSSYPFAGQYVGVVSPKPAQSEDARTWWRSFRLDEVRVPDKQTQVLDELRWAVTSPVLPASVAKRLSELVDTIEANRGLLFEVLSEAGRELPEHFPAGTPPETFEISWISDKFFSRFTALKPRVNALTKEIREYLATDRLMKPWKS